MCKQSAFPRNEDALVELSKLLTPEERLEAHLRLSKLVADISVAAIRRRARKQRQS